MPEDDEILKNGTGDFSRIRKDSFYWYKKVIEFCGEKL
jgi:6-phospho-beta-glucosidase